MFQGDFDELATLDREDAEEKIARDRVVVAHYKAMVRQLGDGEIPTPVQAILNDIETGGRIFEKLSTVNPPAISQDERKAYGEHNFKAKIRKAIDKGEVAELQFCLGPNFFLKRKKFIEEGEALHYQWLQTIVQLSMVQTTERIILQFIREHGLGAIHDADILKSISSRQLNDRVHGLKIKLLEAFSGDAVIPEAWQVEPAFKRHVLEYMQKLWESERKKYVVWKV